VHQALEGYRETEATIHRVYPALNYPGIIYSTHIRFYETKYTKSTKGPIFSDDTSVDRLHNGNSWTLYCCYRLRLGFEKYRNCIMRSMHDDIRAVHTLATRPVSACETSRLQPRTGPICMVET